MSDPAPRLPSNGGTSLVDDPLGPVDDGGVAFPSREYCRAPKDPAAYDHEAHCGACFACQYDNDGGSEDNLLDDRAARDGHGDVMRLIRTNYGNVSLKELVDTVFAHYNEHVRPWVSFGEWSRRSIAEHITIHMADDAIQTNECISALYAQIESLREVCWYREEGCDKALPDVKNIKLLHDLTKSTSAMIEARAKRR